VQIIKYLKTCFILLILLTTFNADSLSFRTTKIIIFTTLGEFNFYVEVAETPEQLAYGLSNRAPIQSNSGMLFLFPTSIQASMWMKDVNFNLDMIFLNRSGLITEIYPSTLANSQAVIQSKEPIRAVLELHENTVNQLGLKIGDRVRNESFN